MHSYEKKAFLKFFIIYFVSVALLILATGYFYYKQAQEHLLKNEEFSIIEYARHIKMGDSLEIFEKEFKNEVVYEKTQHIHIENFKITPTYFIKLLPTKFNMRYIKLFKSTKSYYLKLFDITLKIIFVQILLLIIFAFISYKLAKSALKPLQESIITLDKFTKDLIHDLNTPVTAIKLNMKLLEKNLHNTNAFNRLNKSVYSISELHENLRILLEEETFQMQQINICDVVSEVVQVHKQLFPNMIFNLNCKDFIMKINKNAMKQILQNIISNGCKYNVQDGVLDIYVKDNALYIQDNGKGIKEPDKIFQRSYSEENSSGIGLDIVRRLASNMDIKLNVKSDKNGSIFILSKSKVK